jgi:RNA polymerase sigma-70 factor (ECF subfamily)
MSVAHAPGSRECRDLFARLSEYLDGELEPDLCSVLEGHMDNCPPCQAFLESLRRTVDLTRRLPEPELPEPLVRELVETYRKIRDAGED